ncbi:MAG: amino acid ABC transporter permease [Gammaproteobacteria bacterium]|nr:amino acid ABC transporter permease [Gammaproteobacteria bacterium]MDH4315986.1 amino acid ABC transporter permease [Gammaproteobacteria bacterium]MDH5214446.1 amino acid ABC transporter permease [Gammaproteobacteria bacterium]
MFERLVQEAPQFFGYHNLVFIGQAMGRTLWMTLIGCGVGFVCGLFIAIIRQTQTRILMPVRLLVIVYVEFFRRIPFLVILFIVLFAIEPLIPGTSLLGIATVSVCLLSTAFLSEVIRSGLESVPRQQIEGAATLNFSFIQMMSMVILPQSWRVILPPAAAFIVMFIKDTSLASQLGVIELTFAGKMLVNRGFSPILGFGAILLCYFMLSYPLSRFAAYLEKRLESS